MIVILSHSLRVPSQESLVANQTEAESRVTSLQQKHDDVIAELRHSFEQQQLQEQQTHDVALQVWDDGGEHEGGGIWNVKVYHLPMLLRF